MAIGEGLLRSHGRVTWNHDFGLRDVEPTVLTTPDGISIRVQVLRKLIYANWPVQLTKIDLRYSDVRPAGLCVPTIESFVA